MCSMFLDKQAVVDAFGMIRFVECDFLGYRNDAVRSIGTDMPYPNTTCIGPLMTLHRSQQQRDLKANLQELNACTYKHSALRRQCFDWA